MESIGCTHCYIIDSWYYIRRIGDKYYSNKPDHYTGYAGYENCTSAEIIENGERHSSVVGYGDAGITTGIYYIF